MKRVVWLLVVALCGWAWSERQALGDFPGILAAYSAKEYCSCRFVMGFTPEYCGSYVKQWLPLSHLQENTLQRQITAEGLGQRAQARWQGPRAGCRLLP